MFSKIVSNKAMVIASLVLSAFIIYPNIINLSWDFSRHTSRVESVEYIGFFIFRYAIFFILLWLLLTVNIRKLTHHVFLQRFWKSVAVTAGIYCIYLATSLAAGKHNDCFSGVLLFQFLVACIICSLTGHIYALYSEQRVKEQEIEQLRLENLQSRCEALANQINPHFFFNSLNGLTALVRNGKKTQTLEYINKLSGVFRYILHSDKKGLVPLGEELEFLNSFRYLQEIRYADKFYFSISIPDPKKFMLLPVLSLLPLIENVVKHNMIDSENQMCVSVFVTEKDELVVANPVHNKLDQADRNGIGLANLSDRFWLLTGKKIRVESKDGVFCVYLPLSPNS
ncbi:MAG: histidine kinase [Prevotellaceae bacterium]|jgi:sensor histidine kinase YesM|nr:histidine kinase [Prevotellaceae bacterium]